MHREWDPVLYHITPPSSPHAVSGMLPTHTLPVTGCRQGKQIMMWTLRCCGGCESLRVTGRFLKLRLNPYFWIYGFEASLLVTVTKVQPTAHLLPRSPPMGCSPLQASAARPRARPPPPGAPARPRRPPRPPRGPAPLKRVCKPNKNIKVEETKPMDNS